MTDEQAPDSLLLDEMFTPRIAELLSVWGIDCTAVSAEPALAACDDGTILGVALADGRILVTNNVVDFERLRTMREALPLPVPGLIYTDDRTFPRNLDYIARIVDALELAARSHVVGRHGGVYWLP